MSGLVENFIRRIEKINTSLPTIPQPGTNHVDDTWLNTDIYPGELSLRLSPSGNGIYTSDGVNVIHLNKEDVILGGMILSKDTSGVNKITVSSGTFRIGGIVYDFTSSGTDILLPFNIDTHNKLYFVYARGGSSISFVTTNVSGSMDLTGIFEDITTSVNYPSAPANSILLGTVLVPIGATGYDLWPVSVSELGDYYPKFSLTPSELLRQLGTENRLYNTNYLYFPNQILYDNVANAEYISKKIFVSDSLAISTDVTAGNIVQVSGSGGGGGGTYLATNVGLGTVGIYQTTSANTFKFRTMRGSGNIIMGYTASGSNEIYIGLSYSGLITSLQNTTGGYGVYKGLTNTSIAELRSLKAGSNVTLGLSGDSILVSVPAIGTTARGENIYEADGIYPLYGGMHGDNLTFNSLFPGDGMNFTIDTPGVISISTTAKNNNGINVGNGPINIYAGMSGDDLKFRSLTAGSNITITNVGNLITISSTGGGGAGSTGLNVGATGATSGRIYRGMSGSSQLKFGSITSGYGISISEQGDNIQIDATITNGPQGRQGFQGPQGPQGFRGFQGVQGFQGAAGTNGTNGANGTNGSQGYQGPNSLGPQGNDGPVGAMGPVHDVAPLQFAEVYDNGIGWAVPSASQKLITFNTNRTVSSIFTINQLSPSGSGTTIQSSEEGSYLFDFNISLYLNDSVIARFSLYNVTTSTEVPSTYAYVKGGGSFSVPSMYSVNMKAIIDNYNIGDEYGVLCWVDPGVVGSANGLANGSTFTVLKLEAVVGASGSQGPQGIQGNRGFQGLQGSTGTTGINGVQGPQGLSGSNGTLGPQGPVGYLSELIVSNIGATTYSLTSTDATLILQFTANSAVTVTIPPGLTPSRRFEGKQLGTGQVSFVGGSGVTIRTSSTENPKTAEQYSVFAIDWISSETYMIYGKLELV